MHQVPGQRRAAGSLLPKFALSAPSVHLATRHFHEVRSSPCDRKRLGHHNVCPTHLAWKWVRARILWRYVGTNLCEQLVRLVPHPDIDRALL